MFSSSEITPSLLLLLAQLFSGSSDTAPTGEI